MKNISIAALLLLTAISANVPAKVDMKMIRSFTIHWVPARTYLIRKEGSLYMVTEKWE